MNHQLHDYLFTSESVAEGHPDKVCDQISDAILDLYLSRDSEARVALETLATTNFVCLAGETRSSVAMDKDEIIETARQTIKKIGYNQDTFHWQRLDVAFHVHGQSADIAVGVDSAGNKDEGAGDQGIMFGFACKETPDLMPATLHYSHRILEVLADARHSGKAQGLGPDAKSQVTLRYVDGKPVEATTVVCSTQHSAELSQDEVHKLVEPYIHSVMPKEWMTKNTEILINPTGRFVIGGPDGDTGLTGRKIIVDTYGGAAPHGGGAFSGKDPTKVDRSAAYVSRWLAKNIVAAGFAERCTIQLSYAIGVARPLSLYVNTHGTGTVDETKISKAILDILPLTPRSIRERLQMNKPIYLPTAAYGHFGRKPTAEGHFSWEKLDLVDDLKSALK
ncbi:MAG: methionine adenosyltransferase [Bdellovibrionales bacterium]